MTCRAVAAAIRPKPLGVSSNSGPYSRGARSAGAAGVSEDAGLARSYASIRTLRLADGPDEVHRRAIARLEYKKHR